jgi:hypothetical protein
MRAIVRRHRLRVGDSLVVGPPDNEVVLPPIAHIGDETVVLVDATILECPSGQACYIERNLDENSLLRRAEELHGQGRASRIG